MTVRTKIAGAAAATAARQNQTGDQRRRHADAPSSNRVAADRPPSIEARNASTRAQQLTPGSPLPDFQRCQVERWQPAARHSSPIDLPAALARASAS